MKLKFPSNKDSASEPTAAPRRFVLPSREEIQREYVIQDNPGRATVFNNAGAVEVIEPDELEIAFQRYNISETPDGRPIWVDTAKAVIHLLNEVPYGKSCTLCVRADGGESFINAMRTRLLRMRKLLHSRGKVTKEFKICVDMIVNFPTHDEIAITMHQPESLKLLEDMKVAELDALVLKSKTKYHCPVCNTELEKGTLK